MRILHPKKYKLKTSNLSLHSVVQATTRMENINKVIWETIQEGAREASKMKLQEALDSDFFERQADKMYHLYHLKRVQERFGIDACLKASREMMLDERKEKRRREKEQKAKEEDEREKMLMRIQKENEELAGRSEWGLYLKEREWKEKIEEERKLRDAEETKKREEDFERRLKDLERKEKEHKEEERREKEQKAKEAIERKAKKDAEKAEKQKHFQRRN